MHLSFLRDLSINIIIPCEQSIIILLLLFQLFIDQSGIDGSTGVPYSILDNFHHNLPATSLSISSYHHHQQLTTSPTTDYHDINGGHGDNGISVGPDVSPNSKTRTSTLSLIHI